MKIDWRLSTRDILILIMVGVFFYIGYDLGYDVADMSHRPGLYSVATEKIIIRSQGRTSGQLMSTAFHEIGHYIWFEELSYSERQLYKQMYKNTTEYVSDYAKTAVEEDFADTYQQAIQCKVNTSLLPNDRKNILAEVLS